MKLTKPKNPNYCATVVRIQTLNRLDNCDNIQQAIIFGNSVMVGIDVIPGDIGIYFPPETRLSDVFLHNNNLYRTKEKNKDQTKAGYIEDNGRIRTIKFRGHQSIGLFMPFGCLSFIGITLHDISVNDTFDVINDIEICSKYIREYKRTNSRKDKTQPKKKRISKLIPNQFRFHEDTLQFGKNIHKIAMNDIISVTYKVHGTSVVVSNILCKKPLKWYERFLKACGINVVDQHYDNIYSSRKVVKNDYDAATIGHYYKYDIWGIVNQELKSLLPEGMTVYAEIVGFTPDGGYTQKKYDYSCDEYKHKIYIYRITYTNPSGHVYEFSAKQVQQWCEQHAQHGVRAVPECFYGTFRDFLRWTHYKERLEQEYDATNMIVVGHDLIDKMNPDDHTIAIRQKYCEGPCVMCQNKVPREGIVIRPERMHFEAYKLKGFEFLMQETKALDKGEEDIEENQSQEAA